MRKTIPGMTLPLIVQMGQNRCCSRKVYELVLQGTYLRLSFTVVRDDDQSWAVVEQVQAVNPSTQVTKAGGSL